MVSMSILVVLQNEKRDGVQDMYENGNVSGGLVGKNNI